MLIGVDATCWQNNRGYGRQARGLLNALVRLDEQNTYTFVMDSAENSGSLPSQAKVRMVRTTAPAAVAASSDGHRSVRDMWHMSSAMSSPEFDLLLFPTVYSYVPVFSRAKKMVMIHDVIAESYSHLTLPSQKARLLWNAKVALGRWQADAVITVSEYSRRGILKHFKIPAERVFVVGEASDPVFRLIENPAPTACLTSLSLQGNDRKVVYVGGFSPHKNLEALVAAFGRIVSQEAFSDVRLVMVGQYEKEVFHSYFGTIKRQVGELGIEKQVVFTGYLSDEDLVVLLNLSTVLVLPSLMEGFGLPAIEAAACGCPVIATTESPLPKLLGGGGLYVNPTHPEELETALVRLLESETLRRQVRKAGLEAAGQLTWEAAARQMIGVILKLTSAREY